MTYTEEEIYEAALISNIDKNTIDILISVLNELKPIGTECENCNEWVNFKNIDNCSHC